MRLKLDVMRYIALILLFVSVAFSVIYWTVSDEEFVGGVVFTIIILSQVELLIIVKSPNKFIVHLIILHQVNNHLQIVSNKNLSVLRSKQMEWTITGFMCWQIIICHLMLLQIIKKRYWPIMTATQLGIVVPLLSLRATGKLYPLVIFCIICVFMLFLMILRLFLDILDSLNAKKRKLIGDFIKEQHRINELKDEQQ